MAVIINTSDLILNHILENSGMPASVSKVLHTLNLNINYSTTHAHIKKLINYNQIIKYKGRYYSPDDPFIKIKPNIQLTGRITKGVDFNNE